MPTSAFTFGSGATSVTTATGLSDIVNTLNNGIKTVQAALDSGGGTATVLVYGSIFGTKTNGVLLDTLALSGANGTDAFDGVTSRAASGFDSIWLNVSALSTGASVKASVRHIHG